MQAAFGAPLGRSYGAARDLCASGSMDRSLLRSGLSL